MTCGAMSSTGSGNGWRPATVVDGGSIDLTAETIADDRLSDEPTRTVAPTTARAQIRGSSLLLVGRAIAMAANFIVQVLTVRYLTKADYGAFAYALSIVDLGQMVATLGMDRTIARYLPIDDEARRYDRLFGTLVFSIGLVLGLGLATVLAVVGVQALLPGGLIGDSQAAMILVILILLSPIQALDSLFTGLLSVFASPRSIFIRRFLLAPGLKLAAVSLLVLTQAGVAFLAWGYVAAGAIGIAVYAVLLLRLFARRGLLARLRWRSLEIPVRELLLFALPLLTTDLVYIVLNTSDAIFLGLFRGTADVAAFRVVIPAAGLNQLVFSSFTLLFVPAASRLLARNERAGIHDLYWQTAVWMAVISFPLFAATFSFASDLTRILYGSRYADSALYLAMLSFGYYVNTALGFNGLTLRVYGAIRPIVLLNVAAAVLNVLLNLALIPTLGPLGAAIGTTTALVVHNALKQIALYRVTGISPFEPRYFRVYLVLVAAAVGLLILEVVVRLPTWLAVFVAAAVSAAVFLLTRSELRIADTFPEVRRIPVLGWLAGAAGDGDGEEDRGPRT
jgi:O-antigen/teichoic acid export membrane protein